MYWFMLCESSMLWLVWMFAKQPSCSSVQPSQCSNSNHVKENYSGIAAVSRFDPPCIYGEHTSHSECRQPWKCLTGPIMMKKTVLSIDDKAFTGNHRCRGPSKQWKQLDFHSAISGDTFRVTWGKPWDIPGEETINERSFYQVHVEVLHSSLAVPNTEKTQCIFWDVFMVATGAVVYFRAADDIEGQYHVGYFMTFPFSRLLYVSFI